MYRCASGTFDRYDGGMRWHNPGPVRRPPGFVEPCLPSVAYTVPIGPQWAYEIKRDGNRFVCRRETAFGYSPGAATIGLTGCRCGRAQSDPRNPRRELLILIRP